MNSSQLHLKTGMILSFSFSFLQLKDGRYAYSISYSNSTSLSGFSSTTSGFTGKKTEKEPIQHTIILRDAGIQLQKNNTIKWITTIVSKQGWHYFNIFVKWILPASQMIELR